MPNTRIVVGLGNPGPEYRGTRHNVGFEVIERLAREVGVRFERFRQRGDSGKPLGKIAEDTIRGFALVEPSTFMNLSGVAVAAARDRYDSLPGEIVVVCDDFNLPLGRIRVRPKGSAGGHNGLKSIIASLATDEFPRVRIGLGGSPGNWEDFVLSTFTAEERETVLNAVTRVSDALAAWCVKGDFDQLMNILNAAPPDQS
ncbi:MAG: aminoacyl-tRNA hydrolase [Planctomycetota bacterium]